jgi:hypothetical protein
MKRGLITWDKAELPPSVFETRLAKAREALASQDLPALVIYTDVSRSNEGRFFTNFMPYWNRSLIVIPREGLPTLLCALSPRVYPWIRSVTVLEDIRPAGKLVPSLLQLCSERGWKKLGVLDLPNLTHEVWTPICAGVEITNVTLDLIDDAELGMRRQGAQIARAILSDELPKGAGVTGYQFSGRLERAFRRAGAEDLVLLLWDGYNSPASPKGSSLGSEYSVFVSMEYRGHWVQVIRAQTSLETTKALHDRFAQALRNGDGISENLSGAYPFELGPGPVSGIHVEIASGMRRLMMAHGDTCYQGRVL